jgi:ABC-type glutathione transport system ATPase component
MDIESLTRPPVLSVRGVSVCFATDHGWIWANRNINLEVWPGEIVAVVGESGSGKTTVFKAITGLLDGVPGGVAGEIHLKGRPIWPNARKLVKPFNPHNPKHLVKDLMGWDKSHRELLKPVLGRDIGLVFQEPVYSLDPRLTVRQQFEEILERHDHPYGGFHARRLIYELLADMKLDPYETAHKTRAQLSGGECQRVSLAMAIIMRPRLLLCDEPTTAVDLEVRGQLHKVLDRYAHEDGNAVLLITHHWQEVQRLADRIVFMDGGQSLEWVDTETLREAGPGHLHPGTANWRGDETLSASATRGAGEAFPETDGCPFALKCGPAAERGDKFVNKCLAGPVPNFKLNEKHTSRCWLFEQDSKLKARL